MDDSRLAPDNTIKEAPKHPKTTLGITHVPDGTEEVLYVGRGLQTQRPEHDVEKRMTEAEVSSLQANEQQLTRQALWERKLLDFSLRNSLLHTRLGKRAMQFVSPGGSWLEDSLQAGDSFTLQPWPESIKLPKAEDGCFYSSAQSASVQPKAEEGVATHSFSTYLSAAELKSVLTNLYRGARTALEENGANALFIAVGMLRWYVVPQSETPRYAPILLVPVDIIRHGGSYVIRMRDEETILNITLVEFLQQQYQLPITGLPSLPRDGAGIDVQKVFETVKQAITQQTRWDVLDECVLGLFSFSKFVMWNDIHSNSDRLLESPIVQSLVERRLKLEESLPSVDIREFDLNAQPAEVAIPIAADSSQLEAVIESGRGKSFILYGPPGTGKSQTITNIIANALYHGRRVLFVAEKMAALQVVQKRLEQIGLEPFCLELHSNKVTKTHFLQQLQQALNVTHGRLNENFSQRSEELFALRQQLNSHMTAMHRDSQFGLSLSDCIEGYLALPDTEVLMLHEDARQWTLKDLDYAAEKLSQADTLFQLTGHPCGHPLTGLLPKGNRREELANLETLLHLLQEHSQELEPSALAAEWDSINKKSFLSRLFSTRSLLSRLRKLFPELNEKSIPNFFSDLNQITATDATTIAVWLEHREQWHSWAQWVALRKDLLAHGLSSIVEYIETGHTAREALHAHARTLYKYWALEIIDQNDDLRRFIGLVFEDVIDRYRQLTSHFQELTKKELYCRLAARIPSLAIEAAASSEVNILKRNIANGGRGSSIRHIIDQIPTLLPKLCPCMLMSPISVAQFIDLSWPKFDLVVFDEASQMPTSEAIGAIGRGRALIVVGDNRQMPPSSFFSTQQVDEEEAELDDLDSILDDCQALSVPEHYLAFHYRSKHESLIAFSNQHYYDGRLYTFPSADDRISKVSLVKVDGTYDKGGQRSNRTEAEAVVTEIIRRLAEDQQPRRSIGVVAFSVAQQNLIEDVLMEVITGKPELEQRAFSTEEPIFIKNLENVQGDERDVILFSIGYGPDKNGKVSMNFGPLNNRGGERRLNVAITRARYEMMVFSTLRAEHIDLKRSTSAGVEGLKMFLQFAEEGTLSSTASTSTTSCQETTEGIDTLSEDIAASLRQLGYEATTRVGRSQFKVDVAISDPEHPDCYLLGLLTDGKSRLSAKIARDRELTQPAVLEGLGWRVMRVWSIEWMQSRESVLNRIVEAIQQGHSPNPSAQPLQLPKPAIVALPLSEQIKGKAHHWQESEPIARSQTSEPIEHLSPQEIDRAILQVVDSQVSLSCEDLLRVCARHLGYSRRSKNTDATIMRHLGSLIVKEKVIRDGETLKSSDSFVSGS